MGIKEAIKAITALEKQIPKKPKENYNWCDYSAEERAENSRWFCAKCNMGVDESQNYCPECGQKIGWD